MGKKTTVTYSVPAYQWTLADELSVIARRLEHLHGSGRRIVSVSASKRCGRITVTVTLGSNHD